MSDVKFNIYSGVLKAYDAGDGVRRLKTTASSTIRDLSGDTMTLKALRKMAETAERNMTIFLNHKYQVPEDVLGSVEKATLKEHSSEVWDLEFDVRVEESNPRAVKTHEAIVNGTQLGTSIGALIPQGGATKNEDGLLIDDVILLEASIVGIPANPRSFVHYAVKAYQESEDDLGDPQSAIPPFEGAAWDAKAKVWVTVDTDDTAAADDTAASSSKPAGGKAKKETDEVTTKSEDFEADKDTSPVAGDGETTTETDETAGPSKEDKADDNEAAKEQPADTDVPATQEAPESAPESDGGEDDPANGLLGKSILVLEELLKATGNDLVETRKALATETEKRVSAERELGETKETLKLARQIVERISALPIGRRTGFASEVTEFRTKFAGLYGADVIELLEK